MKKQGPPEPLSEAHFANLKRKKGIPVDEPAAEGPRTKKKQKTAQRIEHAAPSAARKAKGAAAEKRVNGKSAAAKVVDGKQTWIAQQQNGGAKNHGAAVPAASKRGGKKAAAQRAPKPESESDDESMDDVDDDDDDEFGGAELLEASSDSDLNPDPTAGTAKLGDNFLGSDSDSAVDDSVLNSGDDQDGMKGKFVFSDDEDDDELGREERLTAANIEGLSAKLDAQRAEEAAAHEEELREEAALTTNIDEDDEGDEGVEGTKQKKLLAPDLQMLRTRITETIRVLEDFAKLGEEGKSRVEYMDQLRKDFCDCTFDRLLRGFGLLAIFLGCLAEKLTLTATSDYGYSDFLAEKLMCVALSAAQNPVCRQSDGLTDAPCLGACSQSGKPLRFSRLTR